MGWNKDAEVAPLPQSKMVQCDDEFHSFMTKAFTKVENFGKRDQGPVSLDHRQKSMSIFRQECLFSVKQLKDLSDDEWRELAKIQTKDGDRIPLGVFSCLKREVKFGKYCN